MSSDEIKKKIQELAWPSFVNHQEWVDENGQYCSAWEFKTPGAVLRTGDGGARMMMEALKEASNKRNPDQ